MTRATAGRTTLGQGTGGSATRGGSTTATMVRAGGSSFEYRLLLSNVVRDAERQVRDQQVMHKSLRAAVYWSGEVLAKVEAEWVELRVRRGEEILEGHPRQARWEEEKTWEYARFAVGGGDLEGAFKDDGRTINERAWVWKIWNEVAEKLGKLTEEQLALVVESRNLWSPEG